MTEDIERLLVDESALNDLMRDHIAWVSKCLSDGRHQSWTPYLAALVKEAPEDKGSIVMHCLAVPFNEHEEKHGALRMCGRKIYEAKKIPVAPWCRTALRQNA